MSDEENGSGEVTISVNTIIAGSFVLGLALGLSGGLILGSGSSLLSGADTPNTNPKPDLMNIAGSIGADTDQLDECFTESNNSEVEEDISSIQESYGNVGTPAFFIGNSEIGYQVVSGAQPVSNDSTPNLVDDIEEQLQEAEDGDTEISENETRLENISFEGEPSLGNAEAPINVVEYSDYGCPWCAEWAGFDAIPQRPIDQLNNFQKLKTNYVETGDVRFIYKDFPVEQLHPNAQAAHKAANCVLEQDKSLYWEFHDKLFEERDQWMR